MHNSYELCMSLILASIPGIPADMTKGFTQNICVELLPQLPIYYNNSL